MFFVFLSFIISKPTIIPEPVEFNVYDGQFVLKNNSLITYEDSFSGSKEVAEFSAQQLSASTGYSFKLSNQPAGSGIHFGLSNSMTNKEGYLLFNDDSVVYISASTRNGLFYGFQSFLQLMPKEIYSSSPNTKNIEWTAPIVSITDYPRFEWRGFMIDSARHFFNVTVVKNIIDAASHYKLNTFHWHLTDDQGWRLEIKKYPTLTSIGSYRESSPMQWAHIIPDNVPYGPYYYTEEEVQDIIEYSRLRGITIVPEIDMPGHTLSLLASNPEFSCTGGPFKVATTWGVMTDVLCAGNDEAISFVKSILDEVVRIFPGNYIHVGGDECTKTRWKKCSKCQKRIKDEGLKNEDELETWFIDNIANYIETKGRHCIGWDEIMKGKLPEKAAIMSWTGTEAGEKAAEQGRNVVMTPSNILYLDYHQFGASEKYEHIGDPLPNHNPMYNIYMYNPTEKISEDKQKYILGCAGNIWSEYIYMDKEDIDYKAFPRLVALAESSWTPLEKKDWLRFLSNLGVSQLDKIRQMGILAAPIQLGTIPTWIKGDFAENKYYYAEWDISGALNTMMNYQIAFIHTSGVSKLKIRNVHLKYAGISVSSDDHDGTASFDDAENNVYNVHPHIPFVAGSVTISAELKCENGTDTSGVIYIYPVN